MDFLNILAVILIACAACTGIVIAIEALRSLFFIIKNRVMPILSGEKGKKHKTIEMMVKDKKSEIPTYEELKHENEQLRRERVNMKAHINRLLGIMDALLSVKNELERKLMIRPHSSEEAGVNGRDPPVAFPDRNSNMNTNEQTAKPGQEMEIK